MFCHHCVQCIHLMLLIRLALPLVPWPYYDDLFGSSPPKRLVVCMYKELGCWGEEGGGDGTFFSLAPFCKFSLASCTYVIICVCADFLQTEFVLKKLNKHLIIFFTSGKFRFSAYKHLTDFSLGPTHPLCQLSYFCVRQPCPETIAY